MNFPALTVSTIRLAARTAAASDRASAIAAERACDGRSGGGAAASHAHGAGLVSFKTTAQSEISFAKEVVALRRVKRLKRSVWASGHLHGLAENGFRPSQCWFVTLTYAEAGVWAPTHLSKAVKGYRDWCRSVGVACRYTWVAEIQPKRAERTGENVVHYHLLAWLPVGVRMPHWDRPTRKRGGERAPFWVHGFTNTQKALAGVGYLMKYLSKLGELTIFPKGLRLYGIGGLTDTGRNVRRWFNLPEWVKLEGGVGDVIKKGRDFIHRATGEILPPAYKVKKGEGFLTLIPLRELASRFFDGAFSTFPRVS